MLKGKAAISLQEDFLSDLEKVYLDICLIITHTVKRDYQHQYSIGSYRSGNRTLYRADLKRGLKEANIWQRRMWQRIQYITNYSGNDKVVVNGDAHKPSDLDPISPPPSLSALALHQDVPVLYSLYTYNSASTYLLIGFSSVNLE